MWSSCPCVLKSAESCGLWLFDWTKPRCANGFALSKPAWVVIYFPIQRAQKEKCIQDWHLVRWLRWTKSHKYIRNKYWGETIQLTPYARCYACNCINPYKKECVENLYWIWSIFYKNILFFFFFLLSNDLNWTSQIHTSIILIGIWRQCLTNTNKDFYTVKSLQ